MDRSVTVYQLIAYQMSQGVILIYKGQHITIIANQSRAVLNAFESCFQTLISKICKYNSKV